MIELHEQNVTQYLRENGKVSPQDLLIQSLSGGVANTVLKIFDPAGGPKVGTDVRSQAQKNKNAPDNRMNRGTCMVLKQPLPKFKTDAEWLVDIDRVKVEHDAMALMGDIAPAGTIPNVLWFDDANYILAMSCAPTGSVIWKRELLAGRVNKSAAQHAGMLLAMIHSATTHDPRVAARFGDPKLFIQQRTDPYFNSLIPRYPALEPLIKRIVAQLLTAKHCLIHGDFSPKNIFLIPSEDAPVLPGDKDKKFDPSMPEPPIAAGTISNVMLLDFEVCFQGHAGFDVGTLLNHFMLKAFLNTSRWRSYMIAAETFWDTYRTITAGVLAEQARTDAGHFLGALLLARIDGKSPAEYITNEKVKDRIRNAALKILDQKTIMLEEALDVVGETLSGAGPAVAPR